MDRVYEFFEACKEAGLSGEESMREYQHAAEEYRESLIEELEERQSHYDYQQDIIDMYRYER